MTQKYVYALQLHQMVLYNQNNTSNMLKTADQLRNLLNNNRHILLKFYPKQKGKGTINYVYVTLYLILGHPVYIAHIYC